MEVKQWVKIPDVLFFQEGPGVRNSQYTEEGIKLLNVANLVDGKIDLTTSNRYISESEAYGKYKHFLCDDGDFIVASSGIKVEYINKKMGFVTKSMLPLCMNTSTIRFKVLDKSRLNIKYFMYYLKSQNFKNQLYKYITGSAQLNFGPSHLKKIIFPLCDIGEQKIIVNNMDLITKIMDSYNEQLEKYDELIKARFIEMFGNPATPGDKFKTCKLGEVADVKSSHRVFSTEFVNEGVPFYRGTEISVLASGQQPEDPYRISMDHYLKIASDDSKPIRGDLLLPSICNKGQVWMVNTDEPFYYKDGRVLCISPHCSLFDSRYLQFYMKMRTEAEYPKLGSGSTFAEFKIFQLKELLVDIPPMNAQKSFCLFADQVDKSKYNDMCRYVYKGLKQRCE